MIPFNDKYAEMHQKIQDDKDLVKLIYQRAKEIGIIERTSDNKIYFPIAKKNDIFLGLHQDENKIEFANHTIAKLRLLYEVTEGKSNIPRVYAVLDDNVGLLTEDFSRGGKYRVHGTCSFPEMERNNPELFEVFHYDNNKMIIEDDFCDSEVFYHSTFTINRNGIKHTPIVDIDQIAVKEKYKKLYEEYLQQYEYYNDEIFKIHRI